MKGVDTLGLDPHFDGTGYPRWKVLMEAYLQAKDPDVWRVADEVMRNSTKKEKQFDVIAKSIILSSLDVGVFNRVLVGLTKRLKLALPVVVDGCCFQPGLQLITELDRWLPL
jgi:hypothetical protein